MIREIDLGAQVLRISEDSSQDNDAGVVVWDAALVLVHYLETLSHKSQGAPFKGKRAVDVGCGTGVAGLGVATLGAAVVALTDLPHLLPLAARNIQLNSLDDVVSVSALRWGEPVSHLQPPLDLVLASDVFYQASAIPALVSTLRSLSGPSTLLLVAAEHREKLPFPCQQLEEAGFVVQQVPRAELHPEWSCDDISVYQLRLRVASESP